MRRGLFALIPLALGLVPWWIAWQLRDALTYDDAYITLTYAKNIAAGRGFVYNGGEPYLGTTTPLLALLLGGLGALFPRIGVDVWALWVGAVAWVGGIWMAFFIGRRVTGPWGGAFAALVMATLPTFPHVLRAEFPLFIFLGLAGVLLSMVGRYGSAGVLFGLAFLARGDAVILAGLAGLAALWRERRMPWRMLGGFLLILIPWAAYATLAFGGPLPATLGVKRAHRALGAWPHIAVGFWRWLRHSPPALQLHCFASALAAAAGSALFIRERNPWGLAVIGWGVFYGLGYLLLNVPFYAWYATTLSVSLALGASLALARAGPDRFLAAGSPSTPVANAAPPGAFPPTPREPVRSAGMQMAAWAGIAVILLAGAWAQTAKTQRLITWRNPKIAAYLDAAAWLKANTPANATAGFIEVGAIAFFSDRQIIDLLGLVTPGTEPYLKARDNAALFKSLHPEYYIRNCNFDPWGMNRRVHESPYFQENYAPVIAFPQNDKPPVVIYHRSDIPAPPPSTQTLALLQACQP